MKDLFEQFPNLCSVSRNTRNFYRSKTSQFSSSRNTRLRSLYTHNYGSKYQLHANITRYRRQRYNTMQSSACWIWIKARCAWYLFARHCNIATQHFVLSYRFFHLFNVYLHTRYVCTFTSVNIIEKKQNINRRFDKGTTSANNHAVRRYDICMKTIACLITRDSGSRTELCIVSLGIFSHACIQKSFVPSATY